MGSNCKACEQGSRKIEVEKSESLATFECVCSVGEVIGVALLKQRSRIVRWQGRRRKREKQEETRKHLPRAISESRSSDIYSSGMHSRSELIDRVRDGEVDILVRDKRERSCSQRENSNSSLHPSELDQDAGHPNQRTSRFSPGPSTSFGRWVSLTVLILHLETLIKTLTHYNPL